MELEIARTKLLLARRDACRAWPRMTNALLSMTFYERKGIGTIASDRRLKVYYDPLTVQQTDKEQIVYILMKEVVRPILGHPDRGARMLQHIPDWAKELAQQFLGVASDLAIEGVLKNEKANVSVTQTNTASYHRMPRNLCFEEYFSRTFPWQILDNPPEGSGEGGNEQGDGESQGQRGMGDGQCSQQNDGDQQGNGQPPPSQSGGKNNGHQGGNGSQGNQKQGKGSQSPPANPKPRPEEFGKRSDEDQMNRGSGADGQKRDWEDEPKKRQVGQPGDNDGIDDAAMDELRNQLEEGGFGKGDGTAEYGRTPNMAIDPKVNPEQLVRTALQNTLQTWRPGGQERSYRRINKRQYGTPCLRPADMKPCPNIAVAIDTSGSMYESEMAAGIGLVDRVLKGCGVDKVRVLAVDSDVKNDQEVKQIAEVKLKGGGGTHMPSVINAVRNRKGKNIPDLLLIVTDGGTDWPDEDTPTSFQTMAVMTRPKNSWWKNPPSWIKTIDISDAIKG